jgi:hypothetical protein
MEKRYGMKIKTRLSFDELDNVVAQYSRGSYQIAIGGLDEGGSVRRKIMHTWFKQEEDRQRIRLLFAARRVNSLPGQASS